MGARQLSRPAPLERGPSHIPRLGPFLFHRPKAVARNGGDSIYSFGSFSLVDGQEPRLC